MSPIFTLSSPLSFNSYIHAVLAKKNEKPITFFIRKKGSAYGDIGDRVQDDGSPEHLEYDLVTLLRRESGEES